jgi:hypothetical protein
MSPTAKLVSIGFVAPALAFALMSVAWSFIFVALAVLGYPIMVVLTLALLFPLHKVFTRRHVKPPYQLAIVLAMAAVGGLSVYVVLFFDAVFVRDAFSMRLAAEYCAIGLIAGLCAWLLYNFGPLKLSAARPDSTDKR